jgi:hypothetical protein
VVLVDDLDQIGRVGDRRAGVGRADRHPRWIAAAQEFVAAPLPVGVGLGGLRDARRAGVDDRGRRLRRGLGAAILAGDHRHQRAEREPLTDRGPHRGGR